MNFVHGFCNADCRAAVVRCLRRNPLLGIAHRRTFGNEHKVMRQVGHFRRTKQNVTNSQEKVTFGSSGAKTN